MMVRVGNFVGMTRNVLISFNLSDLLLLKASREFFFNQMPISTFSFFVN